MCTNQNHINFGHVHDSNVIKSYSNRASSKLFIKKQPTVCPGYECLSTSQQMSQGPYTSPTGVFQWKTALDMFWSSTQWEILTILGS